MNKLRNSLFALLLSLSFASVCAGDLVNINTADVETLATLLKGIGPSRAVAIIEYRDANGPFKDIESLLMVKGIGERTVEINRHLITVGDEQGT